MGSHLGATLANVFLSFDEQIWLNEHPVIHSPVPLEKFQNYLHSKQ